jgi:WhiB family transcriptional regulator, redox-sensing transcriptional regulator
VGWDALELNDPDGAWTAGNPAEIFDQLLERVVVHRPEWQRRAACRGMGPDVFFLGQGGDPGPARAVCDRCPVAVECLDFSVAQGVDLQGIWAGVGQKGRLPLRRSVRRSA